jgi:hypothetical protein
MDIEAAADSDGAITGIDINWKRKLTKALTDATLVASLSVAVEPLQSLMDHDEYDTLKEIIEVKREEWKDLMYSKSGFNLPSTFCLDFVVAIHLYTLAEPAIFKLVNKAMFNPSRRIPGAHLHLRRRERAHLSLSMRHHLPPNGLRVHLPILSPRQKSCSHHRRRRSPTHLSLLWILRKKSQVSTWASSIKLNLENTSLPITTVGLSHLTISCGAHRSELHTTSKVAFPPVRKRFGKPDSLLVHSAVYSLWGRCRAYLSNTRVKDRKRGRPCM